MKKWLLSTLLLLATPAIAQWQVPDHTIPIGRGIGTGFKNIAPGTAGIPVVSQGAAFDPFFGAAAVVGGGTGLTSGTSGGVLYFNSTTTMASSGLLGANQLLLGGGAGASPTSLGSLGTTTTLLHGNAAGAGSFGAVVNADMATMAAGTVKCNPTTSTATPIDCNYPNINVRDSPYNAAGSIQSTTGSITSGTATLALAAAIDFVNGQGIRVNHAGTAAGVNQVTAASVTPQGAAGGTTYTYTIASISANGGVGQAITNITTATGNATLSFTNFNRISWTNPAAGTTPTGYAIYGRIGGALTFIGFAQSSPYNDYGEAAFNTPDWLPSTPPGASLPDWLITTINSGGGTTSLTLAANASTTATTQTAIHDDTNAFKNAVAALPAAGGQIDIPSLDYPITSAIGIGNGSAGVLSTRQGVVLNGLGNPNSSIFPQPQRPRLLWLGPYGTLLNLAGPLQGWSVKNLVFHCNGLANSGLRIVSSAFGEAYNTSYYYCVGAAITSTTVPVFSGNLVDSLHNSFHNTQIVIPPFDFATGIYLGEDAGDTSDTDVNHFFNTWINLPPTHPTFGVHLQPGDDQFFYGLHLAGGSASATCVLFNYTVTTHTGGTAFFGVDTGNLCGTQWANTGTPGGGAAPNSIYGLAKGNGGTIPLIANLGVFSADAIVWTPGGNVVGTNILGAWSTYTPSPACGTATITSNSARRMTMGKTTHLQFDVTITALGTCTLTLTFTAPINAQANSVFWGQETVNTGRGISCFLPSGSSAVSPCRKADGTNFAVNDRIVVNAIYENQ